MDIVTNLAINGNYYYLKAITHKDCPYCDKNKMLRISVNNEIRDIMCPWCEGTGRIKVDQDARKYEIVLITICKIKVDIDNEGNMKETYWAELDGNMKKIETELVFDDYDEASKELALRNKDRKNVDIDTIIVPRSFKLNLPRNEKINKRLDEWRENKKFNADICLHGDMTLYDGYTSYLCYKMLGIKEVPVVIDEETVLAGA